MSMSSGVFDFFLMIFCNMLLMQVRQQTNVYPRIFKQCCKPAILLMQLLTPIIFNQLALVNWNWFEAWTVKLIFTMWLNLLPSNFWLLCTVVYTFIFYLFLWLFWGEFPFNWYRNIGHMHSDTYYNEAHQCYLLAVLSLELVCIQQFFSYGIICG